MIQHMQFAV